MSLIHTRFYESWSPTIELIVPSCFLKARVGLVRRSKLRGGDRARFLIKSLLLQANVSVWDERVIKICRCSASWRHIPNRIFLSIRCLFKRLFTVPGLPVLLLYTRFARDTLTIYCAVVSTTNPNLRMVSSNVGDVLAIGCDARTGSAIHVAMHHDCNEVVLEGWVTDWDSTLWPSFRDHQPGEALLHSLQRVPQVRSALSLSGSWYWFSARARRFRYGSQDRARCVPWSPWRDSATAWYFFLALILVPLLPLQLDAIRDIPSCIPSCTELQLRGKPKNWSIIRYGLRIKTSYGLVILHVRCTLVINCQGAIFCITSRLYFTY